MNVVERIEWMTDVFKAKRREERRCLRNVPRITYVCKYWMDDVFYGEARELARATGGDPIYVPDWPNDAELATVYPGTVSLPVDATFAPAYQSGGAAILWDAPDTYEVVTVTAVGTGTISTSATTMTHAKPLVAPLRLGTFSGEFGGERGPYESVQASAEFTCVITEDLSGEGGGIGYPTYLGDQVITEPVEIINGAGEKNLREVDIVDSQVGQLYKYPLFSSPNQLFQLGWTCRNAQDLWNRRLWLHSKKGRWKQFWTSSWNADVVITRDISPGDTTIEIEEMGFASRYPAITDWAIIAPDGGMWFARATGATPGAPGRELLSLTDHFSGSASLANIAKTCKLTLSRLDSDRIDIQHLPGRQATIVVATKEVPIYP